MCKEVPNIIGWKMLYFGMSAMRIARALKTLDRHVGCLWAGAMVFHEYLPSGYFDGSVSGFFNYGMESMIDHINAWRRKDVDEALRIWKSGLEDLHFYVGSTGHGHVAFKLGAWTSTNAKTEERGGNWHA